MFELNSTDENYLLANHPCAFTFMITSILVGIIGSGVSVILIQNKLTRLNCLIKSILYFMAGQTFISSWIRLVITILMGVWHLQNFSTCIILQISRHHIIFGNVASIATISQIRYYIALKTTQMKVYKKKTLQYCIVGVHFLVYVGGLLNNLLTGWYGRLLSTNSCIGSNYELGLYWPFLMFRVVMLLSCIFIGLIGDLCMMSLIWKRKNKVVPGQLIPWKSTKEYDMAVPVHATLLSTVSFALFICLFVIGIRSDSINWILPSILNIWIGLAIPFIIMKVIKTKKQHPVIPHVLHMYDENEDPRMIKSDKVRNKDFKEDEPIVDDYIQVRCQSIDHGEFIESQNQERNQGNEDLGVVLDPSKLMMMWNEVKNRDHEKETMIMYEKDCIQAIGGHVKDGHNIRGLNKEVR